MRVWTCLSRPRLQRLLIQATLRAASGICCLDMLADCPSAPGLCPPMGLDGRAGADQGCGDPGALATGGRG